VEFQTKICIVNTYIILYIYLIVNTTTKSKLCNYQTLRANFNNIKLWIKKLKPLKQPIHKLFTKLKTILHSKQPKYKFKFKFKSYKLTGIIYHNIRNYIKKNQLKWLLLVSHIIFNNYDWPQMSRIKNIAHTSKALLALTQTKPIHVQLYNYYTQNTINIIIFQNLGKKSIQLKKSFPII